MYKCSICNYVSNFSANYKRHLLTNKHQFHIDQNNTVSIVEMSKNPENESYRLKKMKLITAITFLFFMIYITTLFIFIKKLIKF